MLFEQLNGAARVLAVEGGGFVVHHFAVFASLLRIGIVEVVDGLRYGRSDSGGWQQKCCGSQGKQKMHAGHYL